MSHCIVQHKTIVFARILNDINKPYGTSSSTKDQRAIIENSVPTSQLHNFSGKFTFERLIPHRTTTGSHLIVEWSQVDLNSNPLHILLVTATQMSLFSNVGLARIGKGRLHNCALTCINSLMWKLCVETKFYICFHRYTCGLCGCDIVF